MADMDSQGGDKGQRPEGTSAPRTDPTPNPTEQILKLSEADLDFVTEEAAPHFKDKAKLKQLILEDQEFRKGLVGHDKVAQRVMGDNDLLPISPALYFEVLLRRCIQEISGATHTVERSGRMTIAVFDTQEVLDLLSRQPILQYLADMLASFTRIESYVIPVRVKKGVWRKDRFSDFDIASLVQLSQSVEEERRLSIYKRIADVCLFILGMFPESAAESGRYQPPTIFPVARMRMAKRLTAEEYQREGRRFYRLAEEHPMAQQLKVAEVFGLLQENFDIARKPLNFISEHYLS